MRIYYAHLSSALDPIMKRTSTPAPARKRPTNLSIRGDLLERAKQLNINLSAAFETFLEQHLAEQSRHAWRENNQEAIADYNQQVETHGVFSKGRRRF
jgi:antitoxin CcdA